MPLRTVRTSDVPPLAAWLPDVAKAIGCEPWSSEDALRDVVGRENTLIYHDATGAAFVAYELHAPKRNAAHVKLLAVAPDKRRLGIGVRAALALEKRLAKPAARIYVAVPARLGLALYFWLRLGYRPLTQRDWPEAPADAPSTWMVRELR
jgi:ribosomal protein S18 acetylase RimI-like enzyme